MKGNLYYTGFLALASVLFTDAKFRDKKLSELFIINGTADVLLDLIGIDVEAAITLARKTQRDQYWTVLQKLGMMKGEYGYNIHTPIQFKFSELTKGYIPDLIIGTVNFVMFATLGGGKQAD